MAPKNFKVQVYLDYNHLSWENQSSTNATYQIIIERSVDQGEFHEIVKLSGYRDSYNDSSVTNGHIYTYRARVSYNRERGPYTSEVEAINLYPEDLRINNTYANQVDLEWDYPTLPLNREPNYDIFIERRETNVSSWKNIAQLPVTEKFYRDTTVTTDTKYYYRFKIKYDDSSYSRYLPTTYGIEAQTALPLDTTLWGYAPTNNSIRIMWEMPVSTDLNARLEQKTFSGDFKPLYTNSDDNFVHYNLTLGNTYTYRLRMESKTGKNSRFTDEITIKVEEVPSPTELSASAISSDKIIMSWSYPHDNETEFEIWRKGEGPWELLSTVPKNTGNYVDGSISYGQTYIYRVRAKRGDYCFSNFSLDSTVINNYPKNPGPIYSYISGNLLYIFSNEKAPKDTTYTLEFRTDINSPWHEIRSIKNDVLMTNIGFDKNTEYYFRIRADIGNLSSTSPEFHFFGSVPEKPLNLEAPFAGYNSVTLNWRDETEKEEGYKIYRTINGDKKLIGSTSKDENSFIDEAPVMGVNAYYEVIAHNVVGISPAVGTNIKVPKKIMFVDIDSYKWAHDAIYNLQGMGALDNIQSGKFNPQNVITRGQLVSMVLKSFKINYDTSGLFPPTDITPNHKYYKDIITAINLGLIHPDPDGKVYPNKAVTRKDIIFLLGSTLGKLGYPLNPYGKEHIEKFNDYWQIPQEEIDIVSSFVGDGIISGKAGQVLDLNSSATRIEAVAFIYRTLLKYKIDR